MTTSAAFSAAKAPKRGETLAVIGPSLVLVVAVLLVAALFFPWRSDAALPYWILGANFAGIAISEFGLALRLKTTMIDVLTQGRLSAWLVAGVMAVTVWPVGQIVRLESISTVLVWIGLLAPTIAYALILDYSNRHQGALTRQVLVVLGVSVAGVIGGLLLLSRWSLTEEEISHRFLAGRGGFSQLVAEYQDTGAGARWEAQRWDWWWMPLHTATYSPGSKGADEIMMQALNVESVSLDTSIVNSEVGGGAIAMEIRRFRGVGTTPITRLGYSEVPLRSDLLSHQDANKPLSSQNASQGGSCREIEANWYVCTR